VPLSIEQFTQQVASTGLMSADELQSFLEAFPHETRPGDVETLTRELVQQNRLTGYQAAQIGAGQASSLTLGNYVVLDQLGQGGMGMVLKAEHRRMGRMVALKVISPAAMKSPDAVKRFHREVQAAAKLTHPNIVIAYDADEANGTHFLVMEYAEGTDLSALVKKQGPFSVAKAIDCIRQAAVGLQFAHEQGIVHRDIKPANLLIDSRGTVKILDMGLARIEGDTSVNAELTETGAVMGTVDYMAPEQAQNTKSAEARSDIYSLGITLWYLLVGKPAYSGDSLMSRLLAHRDAPIPSLCTIRSDVPVDLDAVFQKMVAKQAKDRFPSMTAVQQALDSLSIRSGATHYPQPSSMGGEAQDSSRTDMRAGTSATMTRELGPTEAYRPSDPQAEATYLMGATANTTLVPIPGNSGTTHPPALASWKQKRFQAIAAVIGLGLLLIIPFLRLTPGDRTAGPDLELSGASPPSDNSRKSNSVAQSQAGAHSPTVKPAGVGSFDGAPPPAITPFDAQQARAHQEAWAKHLDTTVVTSNSIGMTMTLIPPGRFLMGSSDDQVQAALKVASHLKADRGVIGRIETAERPRHPVVMTRPLRISATEVTISQFRKFVEATEYVTEAERHGFGDSSGTVLNDKVTDVQRQKNWRAPGYAVDDDFPVAQISWNDAVAYCRWLSEHEKSSYRLPTEAEWEYACRAGTMMQYSFGDDDSRLRKYGWPIENSVILAHPVGSLLPNSFGLFDMHGNLYEWCHDRFDAKWYSVSPTDDPQGPPDGTARVLRGGSMHNGPLQCRSASRYSNQPTGRFNDCGFRVVQDLSSSAVPWTDWLGPRLQRNEIGGNGWIREGEAFTTERAISGIAVLPDMSRNGAIRLTYLLRDGRGIAINARDRKADNTESTRELYVLEDLGQHLRIGLARAGEPEKDLVTYVIPDNTPREMPRTLEFRVVGDTLTAILNGSAVATTRDSTIPFGNFAPVAFKGVLIQKVEYQDLGASDVAP